MSQHFHGLSAQGQSDAGGTVLDPSVVPGISPFKDTRQIFRTDSHAGIFHDQRFFFFRIQINGNFSFPSIFHGIGKYLLQHKDQPFFIGQHICLQIAQLQGKLCPAKENACFFQGFFDNNFQAVMGKYQIFVPAFQTLILECKFHILFDPVDFSFHGSTIRLFFLQKQAEGSDRRLDLM